MIGNKILTHLNVLNHMVIVKTTNNHINTRYDWSSMLNMLKMNIQITGLISALIKTPIVEVYVHLCKIL